MPAIRSALRTLPPAYFALPMATGIVCIACHMLGMWYFAQPLFWLNILFYVALWALFAARAVLFPAEFSADTRSHYRGPGFFTMIAGTNIVGSQLVLLKGDYAWGSILLAIGSGLWALLIYWVISNLIARAAKPPLAEGISGVWLVAVVGTQSVAVLAALTSAQSSRRDLLMFLAVSMFFIGIFLYAMVITLIFYRLLFYEIQPDAMVPTYWVDMGAVAISALAGATLVLHTPGVTFMQAILPFTKGLTLALWAVATWWIPFLVIFGVWRHGIRRYPLAYEPGYWSMVFPLGMYTVCTLQTARALDMGFLLPLPEYFIYAALAAWLLTFAGMARSVFRTLAAR
ncbi:MAG: tellurite resistance/C4-dicarboxylate transporter family protein [bacterium]|jgi:tellurite resistance protein TehA-like permease